MKFSQMLKHTSHRPWPLPAGPWVMAQRWLDLLFAHWPVPAGLMRSLIPEQLEPDTFQGQAWVGVVPFRMTGVRPRCTPALPWVSAFPELNVRTYVRGRNPANPRPGVYFFSLDAANPVAVRVARSWFSLPYFDADMDCRDDAQGGIRYRSVRTHRGAPQAGFSATYGPTGPIYTARPGTLEHWLTERYSLYTVRRGNAYIGQIQHLPWPLQPARAAIEVNQMAAAAGIVLPDIPPLLHFVRRIDVAVWPLRRV